MSQRMGLQVHFGCIEMHRPLFLAFPATYQQTKYLLLLAISYFLFYSKISRKPVLCSTCHHRIPIRTLAEETLMSCLATGRRKTLKKYNAKNFELQICSSQVAVLSIG